MSYPGVYLDHGYQKDKVFLSINAEGYGHLVSNNIPFQQIKHAPAEITMLNTEGWKSLNYKSNCLPLIDFYPTYEAYEQMMQDFQSQYPDLCKLIEIGQLASGRKILVLQIGDNINEIEDEPNFFYTATMHGDELAGYPMMLQLIDYLLCNYETEDQVKNIVDNINIYINPLANPDGTYRGGNETVREAIRFNNNFVDLNRNFPDPKGGDNPDGRSHQTETEIFMDFADNYNIHMACNLHSGVEVVNYPWDTFSEVHADDDWLYQISREYADTVHSYASAPDFFTDFDNGITNGFAWFEVEGGRQDYMTYFKRAREVTLEVVRRKILDSDRLPEVWTTHKSSLLNYMEESLYGLRGQIRDCETEEYLEAEVLIPLHDKQNSSVFSNTVNGNYFRYLSAGNYQVEFNAEGYFSETRSIDIFDKSSIRVDIELCPMSSSTSKYYTLDDIVIRYQENKILLDGHSQHQNISYTLFDGLGQTVLNSRLIDKSIELNTHLPEGLYYLKLDNGKTHTTKSVFIY